VAWFTVLVVGGLNSFFYTFCVDCGLCQLCHHCCYYAHCSDKRLVSLVGLLFVIDQ